jgi:HAD superfamily hydrolase (TIGR01490 family)
MKNDLAIFDIDGTIINTQSQRLFLQFLRRKRVFSFFAYLKLMGWFVFYKTGLIADPLKAMTYAFGFVTGRSEAQMKAWVREFFAEELRSHIYPEARQLIGEHMSRGDLVVLASNAISYLAEELGENLGVPRSACLGTKLEVTDGKFTGRLSGHVLYSSHKITALNNFLGDRQFENIWAYTDHDSDLELLRFATKPVAVNPTRRLAAVAVAAGWPIRNFQK